MNTLALKKYLGFAFGTMLALMLVAPALFHAFPAEAADADGDCKDDTTGAAISGCETDELDYFGGTGGDDFAEAAGLGTADLVTGTAELINVALGFLGIIAVVLILLGGFKWMTAAGEETKVKDAKKLLFAGLFGLVIILSAYAIASFVITQVSSATTATE